ncbi:GNAT family N-acetyltransferase [Lutimonas sp.]|uniref:GNAT family N-acetyltransferase n=1 Tax=Lutimonas sp. TaxID=1872403 RepID=UPI003D9B246D
MSKEIVLENDRALLRPLESKDFEQLAYFSLKEPDLWTYSLTPASGIENLKTYLSKALDEKAAGTSYPFLVIDKSNNEIAGSTRFYDINMGYRTTQLGYTWYGKRFQGTGLNKNCKYLMLYYAFENWGMERVEFRADHTNKRSIAAMKSIGCVEEGVLRSNCSSPSGRRDSIILSILRDEWYTTVKKNLEEKIKI